MITEDGLGRQGYGADWGVWDRWRRERHAAAIAALGTYAYGNLEVFLSPAGRWMAFHTDDYADVRVHDLEDGRLVATHVYSRDDHYGHTVNLSTYVPTFRRKVEHGRVGFAPMHAAGMDRERGIVEAELWSMPVAFNAWTVWGADHEQMIDLVDLSRIDEGVIALYDRDPWSTTIGAGHVRDFVHAKMTYVLDTRPDPERAGVSLTTGTTGADRGEYVADLGVLVEDCSVRLDVRVGAAEGAVGRPSTVPGSARISSGDERGRRTPVAIAARLPWEEVRDRVAAYEAGKAATGIAALPGARTRTGTLTLLPSGTADTAFRNLGLDAPLEAMDCLARRLQGDRSGIAASVVCAAAVAPGATGRCALTLADGGFASAGRIHLCHGDGRLFGSVLLDPETPAGELTPLATLTSDPALMRLMSEAYEDYMQPTPGTPPEVYGERIVGTNGERRMRAMAHALQVAAGSPGGAR